MSFDDEDQELQALNHRLCVEVLGFYEKEAPDLPARFRGRCWKRNDDSTCYDELPSYVTDIGLAWPLFERYGTTRGLLWDDATCTWIAAMDARRTTFNGCRVTAIGDTAPEAICRIILACQPRCESEANTNGGSGR